MVVEIALEVIVVVVEVVTEVVALVVEVTTVRVVLVVCDGDSISISSSSSGITSSINIITRYYIRINSSTFNNTFL